MFPTFFLVNQRNSGSTNTKYFRDFGVSITSSSQNTDLSHFFICENCMTILCPSHSWYAKNIIRVFKILAVSHIFQIFKSIIGTLPIFMVNFIAIRCDADKHNHNEFMNRELFGLTILPQGDTLVAVVPNVSFKESGASTTKRTHATHITYLVKTFVTNYILPVFHTGIIPQVSSLA